MIDARCAGVKNASGMTTRPPPGSRPRAMMAASISVSLRTGAVISANLEGSGRRLKEGHISRCGDRVGIEHECDPLEPGRNLREQLKPLACQRWFEDGEPGDVAARLVEPRDDADGDGVDQ